MSAPSDARFVVDWFPKGFVCRARRNETQTIKYARRGFSWGFTGRGFNSRRLHSDGCSPKWAAVFLFPHPPRSSHDNLPFPASRNMVYSCLQGAETIEEQVVKSCLISSDAWQSGTSFSKFSMNSSFLSSSRKNVSRSSKYMTKYYWRILFRVL